MELVNEEERNIPVSAENQSRIEVSVPDTIRETKGVENQSQNCIFNENQGFDGENNKEEGKDEPFDGDRDEAKENFFKIEFLKGETDADKPNGIPSENEDSGEKIGSDGVINGEDKLVRPHAHLPQPEAPPGLMKSASNGEDYRQMDRSLSVDMPSIGKFIRDRSNSFVKRISSLKETENQKGKIDISTFTEFHLPGLKIIVQLKKEENQNPDFDFKGRISFFSRSNCRDCRAVRSFFREKRLKYVEINVDVFPEREKELIERTGSASVPQIFFNEKLFGGLVALNSLRNSGEFERRLKEMTGKKCPENAPAVPVYGFDDPEVDQTDELIGIVRVLRQRLPIQDRISKMKIVRNCFSGNEMVEVMAQQLDCGRKKAVEIGRVLARKHFIHHVFGENNFEDGNHLYRFLEHEPTIPKCFNFRGSTNDEEPKLAAVVGRKLTKLMSAILEAYASDDRRHLDYARISTSEEFRRYVNLVQGLQRVDITALLADEKLAFFLNLYNAMVIHAVTRMGSPEGVIDRRTFYSDFQYIVGGYPYSLATIKNGILRCNRRQPYSLVKPFSSGDRRLEVALPKVNPLFHFGLCNGTRSSPSVRFFSPEGIEAELRFATREFFLGDGIEVDLDKRTVHLTKIIKWYSVDFGQEKDILKWILNYLDATKAGLLTHLLSDGSPINIVYKNHNWSLNT
ncbi:glutaredoxin-like protein [Tasmannia lanceolata]|uniref:glutaredoxin-like protein n=1 Tax=Tasmannia lanceolata TaxID=3420 RepID=UPI004063B4A9